MSKGTERYTAARPIAAEGARIGLIACTECGAALVLDIGIDFDVLARHDQWHESIRAEVTP
jgi:hypothetical protein